MFVIDENVQVKVKKGYYSHSGVKTEKKTERNGKQRTKVLTLEFHFKSVKKNAKKASKAPISEPERLQHNDSSPKHKYHSMSSQFHDSNQQENSLQIQDDESPRTMKKKQFCETER